jgi:hypothetical protein
VDAGQSAEALAAAQELSRLRNFFAPVPKLAKSKPIRKVRPLALNAHRTLTEMDIRRIHYLRHGTEQPSEKVWHTYKQIQAKTGIAPATSNYALKKYKSRGYKFVNGRRYNLKKGWERSTKLNKGAVKEFLLSHAVLSKWVGLTLV